MPDTVALLENLSNPAAISGAESAGVARASARADSGVTVQAIGCLLAIIGAWVVGDWILSLPARWTWGTLIVAFLGYLVVSTIQAEAERRKAFRDLKKNDVTDG